MPYRLETYVTKCCKCGNAGSCSQFHHWPAADVDHIETICFRCPVPEGFIETFVMKSGERRPDCVGAPA